MKLSKLLVIGLAASLLFSFPITTNAEEITKTEVTTEPTYTPVVDLCDLAPDRSERFSIYMNPASHPVQTYAGQSWAKANLYRAGNGGPDAYADYHLGGKYDLLTFQAMPYLSTYYSNSTSIITMTNVETGEILYTSNPMTKESQPIVGQINVSNVNMLRIAVNKPSGTLAYTMLKDMILWELNDNQKENVVYTPIKDLTAVIPNSSNIFSQTTTSVNYPAQVYAGQSWENANLYRVGNGSSIAYAEYVLDDQYKLLTFNVMPYLESYYFSVGAAAKIDVINAETGEILYSMGRLTKESEPLSVSADITNVNKIRITVSCENGFTFAYSLIKDLILWK